MDTQKMFFTDNTHEVNRSIAKILAFCSLIIVALMACDWIGIFHFTNKLKWILIVVGIFTTFGPIFLLSLRINDRFLKYYIMLSMSVLIGLLGTQNGIGIYITYILVPIASCMYFNKKFTLRISLASYLVMAASVYINCAGKLEVRFLDWSHMVTFRNYMIGFTLEFLAIIPFIYQVVKRSQAYLMSELTNIATLKEENERQLRASAIYDRTISTQKKTAIDKIIQESDSLTTNCYARLAAGHQFVANIQDILTYSQNFEDDLDMVLSQVGEYFALDRIMYIEGTFDENRVDLSYQWNRYPENTITGYDSFLSPDGFSSIATFYDENGYIELNKGDNAFSYIEKAIESEFTKYNRSIMLGAQVWFPTIVSGEYAGAVCFDRENLDHYSVVDKFLLSELAAIIAAQVNRINSDKANKAKSLFLSNMSHEIRTPMNAIIGMAQVALREEMSDSLRKDLNIILSSSEGLLGIINDILDFSKIESGKIDIIEDDFSTMSLVNDLVTIVNARNLEKQLEIKYNIPENLPATLYGDVVRIKQVMVNFATNSIKYTESGSVSIDISVENRNGKDYLLYKVTDTGIGIREEDKVKLFKSFSQVDEKKNHKVEGTGLGLAISKQLIELMKGTIGFDSEYGKGSSFYFELPIVIKDATSSGTATEYNYEDKKAEDLSFSAPDKKILIVDDNEMNLMVAEALFEPFGMSITTANSGDQALEILKNETFDLIFMDHFMPGKDGVETTHEIRAMDGNPNKDKPIVALTADALVEVKDRLLSEGMNDFLTKPIDMKVAVRIFKRFFS